MGWWWWCHHPPAHPPPPPPTPHILTHTSRWPARPRGGNEASGQATRTLPSSPQETQASWYANARQGVHVCRVQVCGVNYLQAFYCKIRTCWLHNNIFHMIILYYYRTTTILQCLFVCIRYHMTIYLLFRLYTYIHVPVKNHYIMCVLENTVLSGQILVGISFTAF